MSEGFLNKLIPGRGNGKGTTMMNEVGKVVASTSRPYDDSWKKYIGNFPGGPIRRNISRPRGNVNGITPIESSGFMNNPVEEAKLLMNFKYMMLCNKLSTDVKTLCDKKLNDEAFDWKMRTIAEQKAAKKAEAEAAKKKRR
jgi:hypothetical protein